VLVVDADEQPDAELVAEVLAVAGRGDEGPVAYRMRRKDHFRGRWIKYSTLYPSWFVRFFRHDRVRYEPRAVHEYPAVDGPVGELRGHLLHDSFRKGFDDWWAKHVRYAALEAQESVKTLRTGGWDWRGLFSVRDPVRRRRALKALSARLPFRPALRFLYMYLVRRGFLDGRAGLEYCRLIARYEQLIVRNVQEIRRHERDMARKQDGAYALLEQTLHQGSNNGVRFPFRVR
jgi:hypothetical protein